MTLRKSILLRLESPNSTQGQKVNLPESELLQGGRPLLFDNDSTFELRSIRIGRLRDVKWDIRQIRTVRIGSHGLIETEKVETEKVAGTVSGDKSGNTMINQLTVPDTFSRLAMGI